MPVPKARCALRGRSSDSVSGVSLDEEAMLMLKFQRAYEANARFFSAVDDIAAAYQEAEAAVGEDPVAVQQAMDDAVDAADALDVATAELEVTGCTEGALSDGPPPEAGGYTTTYDRDETIDNLVVDAGLEDGELLCVTPLVFAGDSLPVSIHPAQTPTGRAFTWEEK